MSHGCCARPPRPWVAAVLVAATVLGGAGAAAAAEWRIDPARSRIVAHVYRKGALSPLLHDHDLRPERWHGTIAADAEHAEGSRVEVVIDAASLRDDQQALSADDRAHVEAQVRGPDILDAEHHPEIRFVADRVTMMERTSVEGGTIGSGVLHGTLTLHGRSHALDVPVRGHASADAISATGEVSFRPSDFGIAPYSRMLGTIAVEDRVTITVAIEATPLG